MSYAREILAADPKAILAFAKVVKLGHYRRDIPLAAHRAASLVGTMTEDCGPCTQLGVTMALREGVPAQTIAAVIRNDEAAMPDEVRLAVRFARASLARTPEADALRDEIVKRWGKRALVSLAFGLAASRIYPTVKYALGHGKACQRIVVEGTPLVVQHEARGVA
ncbi:MAG TPA: hypothetical protein VFQ53_10625 [Kofleriaceae bacterium]|nr:hypothetical protein [Kofleriaceae bacterium]